MELDGTNGGHEPLESARSKNKRRGIGRDGAAGQRRRGCADICGVFFSPDDLAELVREDFAERLQHPELPQPHSAINLPNAPDSGLHHNSVHLRQAATKPRIQLLSRRKLKFQKLFGNHSVTITAGLIVHFLHAVVEAVKQKVRPTLTFHLISSSQLREIQIAPSWRFLNRGHGDVQKNRAIFESA